MTVAVLKVNRNRELELTAITPTEIKRVRVVLNRLVAQNLSDLLSQYSGVSTNSAALRDEAMFGVRLVEDHPPARKASVVRLATTKRGGSFRLR
jgi:hypothetical protein